MPPPYKGFRFEYPGLPEIARLAISHLAPEGKWESSHGDRVELYEHKYQPDGTLSPHYGEWILRLKSDSPQGRSRFATAEVVQLIGELLPWGEPRTVFLVSDARDATWISEEPEPLGEVLKELYWAVHGEVHRIIGQRAAQAEPQATTPERGSGRKPRGKNAETARKIAKVLRIWEIKGDRISQEFACDYAKTSSKTVKKYRDDLDVLDELERLRQDENFTKEIEGI